MSSEELANKDYDRIARLGNGSTGTVFHIRTKKSAQDFAMKVIEVTELDESIEKEIVQEYEILSRNLRNVVKSEGVYIDRDNKLILFTMKKYEKNLTNYIESITDKTNIFEKMLSIFGDIVRGLYELSKLRIVHRDIKPDNILIDSDGSAAVGDVSEARISKSHHSLNKLKNCSESNIVGTFPYMAPEIRLKYRDNSKEILFQESKADIFSLGMTLINSLDFQKFSFDGQRLNTNEDLLDNYLELIIKPLVPENFLKLLKQMTSYNPHDRPTLYKIAKIFTEEFKQPIYNNIPKKFTGSIILGKDSSFDSSMGEDKNQWSPRERLITELSQMKNISSIYIDLIKSDEGLAGGYLEIEAIETIFKVKIYVFNAWEMWIPCEPPEGNCIRLLEDIKTGNFLPYMKEEENYQEDYMNSYSGYDKNSLFNSIIHCAKIYFLKKPLTYEPSEYEIPLKDLSELDVMELRQKLGDYFEVNKTLFHDKFIRIAKSLKEERERVYNNIIWKDLEREEIILEGSLNVSLKKKLEEINIGLFGALKNSIMKKCGNSGQISFEDLRSQLLGFSRTISSKELMKIKADTNLLIENKILIEWDDNPKRYLNKIEDGEGGDDGEDDEVLYKICNVDEKSLGLLNPIQKSIAEKMIDRAYYDDSHETTYLDDYIDSLNETAKIDYAEEYQSLLETRAEYIVFILEKNRIGYFYYFTEILHNILASSAYKTFKSRVNDIPSNSTVVIFLGKTKVGKSTTINILLGHSPIVHSELRKTVMFENAPLKVGLADRSCTEIPTLEKWMDRLFICDSSGYGDNRGILYGLKNILTMDHLFSRGDLKFKLVHVLDGEDLVKRLDVQDDYNLLERVLTKKDNYENVLFLFNKNFSDTKESFFEIFLKNKSKTKNLNPSNMYFLKNLRRDNLIPVNISTEGKINREEIINKILNLKSLNLSEIKVCSVGNESDEIKHYCEDLIEIVKMEITNILTSVSKQAASRDILLGVNNPNEELINRSNEELINLEEVKSVKELYMKFQNLRENLGNGVKYPTLVNNLEKNFGHEANRVKFYHLRSMIRNLEMMKGFLSTTYSKDLILEKSGIIHNITEYLTNLSDSLINHCEEGIFHFLREKNIAFMKTFKKEIETMIQDTKIREDFKSLFSEKIRKTVDILNKFSHYIGLDTIDFQLIDYTNEEKYNYLGEAVQMLLILKEITIIANREEKFFKSHQNFKTLMNTVKNTIELLEKEDSKLRDQIFNDNISSILYEDQTFERERQNTLPGMIELAIRRIISNYKHLVIQIFGELTEAVIKEIVKVVAKKGNAKTIISKSISKLPVWGLAVGVFCAYRSLKEGKIMSAILNLASGCATTVPGYGTAVSWCLDLVNILLEALNNIKEMRKYLISRIKKKINGKISNSLDIHFSNFIKSSSIKQQTNTSKISNQKVFALSLFGPRSRSFITSFICEAIEKEIGSQLQYQFEIFTGSDSSSLLACLLNVKNIDQNNKNTEFKKRITSDILLNETFVNLGIFNQISSLVESEFQTKKLSDLNGKVLVPYLDSSSKLIKYFDDEALIKDVILASIATSKSDFPPYKYGDNIFDGSEGFQFVDPSLLLYHHLRQKGYTDQNIVIVSIGCGSVSNPNENTLQKMAWDHPLEVVRIWEGNKTALEEKLGHNYICFDPTYEDPASLLPYNSNNLQAYSLNTDFVLKYFDSESFKEKVSSLKRLIQSEKAII